MKKIAVVLSGCGYLDGSEITEAVLTLLEINKQNAEAIIFAPDKDAHHTVNHLKGEETGKGRNVLLESARIARGKVHELSDAIDMDLDALVLPGGYGVAKNLSEFAFCGAEATVHESLTQLIKRMHGEKKPIGAICISPAIIALVLGSSKVEVTIGNCKETAKAIEQTGAIHIEAKVEDIHVDEKNLVISTPAYMYDDGPIKSVSQGIEKLVTKVIQLIE
jgi:enhancing lycopene biosynthesis protein 2